MSFKAFLILREVNAVRFRFEWLCWFCWCAPHMYKKKYIFLLILQ